MATVKTQDVRSIAVRCGRRRKDGSRCRVSSFRIHVTGETVWMERSGPGTDWKRGKRIGAWHEGLMMGDDGVTVLEKARWKVHCNLSCGTDHLVTQGKLEERARHAALQGDSTVWLADLTQG